MSHKLIKMLVRAGIIFMAAIALALAIRGVLNYSSGKRLDERLNHMKAEGIPSSLKEIEPECPPQNNAALDWNLAEAYLAIDRGHLEMLRQAIADIFYGKPIEDSEKKIIQGLIATNREALDLLLGASSKTCFKNWQAWEVIHYELNTKGVFLWTQSFRLIGIDAVLKAEDGHVEEAIDQLLKARRVLKLKLEEPFLIHYLVNMNCLKHIAVCMNAVVSNREIKRETLQKIISEWHASPWNDGLIWALESERIYMLESSRLFFSRRYDYDWGPDAPNDLYYWIFRPFLKNEIVWLIREWDNLIEIAKMPYSVSRNSGKIGHMSDGRSRFYKLAPTLVSNVETTLFEKATLDAMLETALIGIGCKLYKSLHGDFPGNMNELVPQILAEIPKDPFTGKPYVYRKDNSDLSIYSIGHNLKDDGGIGTWKINPENAEKGDDWTWKTRK